MTRVEQLEQKIKRLEQKICCNKTQFYDTLPEFPPVGVENTLYVDNSTGSIYIWDTDTQTYITTDTAPVEIPESKIDLTTELPLLTPLDTNNPTTTEVQAWATANLTGTDLTNGTQLIYNAPSGGDAANPDYTWTVNGGVVTLSNKRVFNTKTVYVDAGSGSDVTGKRGYREFPFKTLNAAIASISDMDLLYVFPGDYVSNVGTDRIINIYCENGVNWQYTSSLTLTRAISQPTTVYWIFDYLYTTSVNVGLTGNPSLMVNSSYGVNLRINRCKDIHVSNQGSSPFYHTMTWHIINSINSHFLPVSYGNQQSNSSISLIIDNNYKTDEAWSVSRFTASDTNFSVKVLNTYFLSTGTSSSSNAYGAFFGGDESLTANKVTTFNLENVISQKTSPIPTVPIFTNLVDVNAQSQSNTFFRAITTVNNDNLNVNILGGIMSVHTVGHSYFSLRFGSKWYYNIKGVQKNGFSYYSINGQNAGDNKVYINLDVISENNAAVYIGLDNSTLNANAEIYISGRIETTRLGFPCITLGANQNNRIVLKDLTLINDSTVSPIMINSSTPENVVIQNVKTNSLITDVNIVEVGEAITRNSNYK
jgi:hypothetical protein